MNDSLLEKRGYVFVQHPLRNVCTKLKVDRTKRFGNGAPQVSTIQKPFGSEIPLTMKTRASNSLSTHFLIKLPSQMSFGIYTSFTLNKSFKQIIFGPFPFLISFFC